MKGKLWKQTVMGSLLLLYSSITLTAPVFAEKMAPIQVVPSQKVQVRGNLPDRMKLGKDYYRDNRKTAHFTLEKRVVRKAKGDLGFGNARGMLGLLWAYRYNGEKEYLNAARKLRDYYLCHYFDQDRDQHGTLGWVATEVLNELYRETNDSRYLDAALRIAQAIPNVNLRSQHTHSYLLSIRLWNLH